MRLVRSKSARSGVASCALLLVVAAVPGQTHAAGDVAGLEARLASARGADRVPLLLALARQRRDEPSAVVASVGEALELLRSHPSPSAEFEAQLLRSRALRTLSDYPEARVAARAGADLARALGRDDLVAEANGQLAFVEWRMADYTAAHDHAEAARRWQVEHAPSEAFVDTLTVLGAIHQSNDEPDAALARYLEALQVGERLAHEPSVARSHNNIGLVYWDLERHEEALAAMQRALAIHERIGPRGHLANTLNNIGLVSIELGRAREALPFLERAHAIDVQSRDLHGQAKCLSNLGHVQERLGDLARALELHTQSLALRERIADKEGIVRSRGAVAEIRLAQGEPTAAVAVLEPAIAVAVEIGARRDEADLQRTLSQAHEKLGDASRAIAAYRRFHTLQGELAALATKQRVGKIESRYADAVRARDVAELEAVAQARQQRIERYIVGTVVLGGCLLVLGVLWTLRARNQRALAESERRYRALFQSSTLPTLLVEHGSGRVLDHNGPAARLCASLLGPGPHAVADLRPEWVRDAVRRLLDGAADAEAVTHGWVDDAGRMHWSEVRGSGVRVDGRSCLLVTVRDVTEERAQQDVRMREDKLRSLGTLAGGIAHDFNNALAAILGHVQLAKDAEVGESRSLLEDAERATLGARTLSQQLIAFARGGGAVREVVDVATLLRESVALANAGSSLYVDVVTDPELWHASLDGDQFRQFVGHLVRRAQAAAGAGGRLRVRAANERGGPDAPAFVRIEFADDGAVIPAPLRQHVFDPYFPTERGERGLGLATAFAICQNHGGTLSFTSEEGRGTTFVARLPASTQRAARPAPSAAEVPAAAGGTALVLDDDELVRNVTRRMLERWGFEVVVVAEGRSAVDRYGDRLRSGRPFDLVVLDLTIVGGMGGRQAFTEMRQLDPHVRAIVASGYSDDPILAHYREAGFAAALAKPFRSADFAQAVNAAFGRHRVGELRSGEGS